ncbi:sigma-70 family RNA polymerase sigma factor [Enhygromyxa salina]|nr:sigma-70 family RNA polymerase sigma factor [Enhygromyxa salina]
MTSSSQQAIARVLATRGFAWVGESALPNAVEGIPLLGDEGEQVGFVARPEDTQSDRYSMLDAIVPLESADRTRLFEVLEQSEFELIHRLLTTVDAQQEQWLLEADARIDSNHSTTLEEADLPGLSRRERAEISMRVARSVLAGEIDFGLEVRAMLDRILELRRRLFADSLRFVVSLVVRYGKRMDFTTGVLRGALGLDTAIDRFEPERRLQFSTYAGWWIRQSITRSSMDYAAALRIPVHASEEVSRFWRVQQELWAQRGSRPSDEEVRERASIKYSIERLGSYRRRARAAYLARGSQLGPAETILDDDVPSPMEGNPASGWVRGALDHLLAQIEDYERRRPSDGRWSAIVTRRVLRTQVEKSTLRELGEEFGVSRERIRQLEVTLLSFLSRRLFGEAEALPPWAWRAPDE